MKIFDKVTRLNIFLQFFLAGCVSALAFAPFDLFLPLVISVSWFFYLINRSLELSYKKIFLLGLSYGIGYFLTGLYWVSISLLTDIARFWWLLPFSITLFPLVLGLFFGFFALVIHFIFNKYKLDEIRKVIIFAAFWLVFELIRGYIFTGFPWNLAGYSMMFSKYSMQSASIFGVYGLSFFAILFCLVPNLCYESRGSKIFAGFLVVLFAANLAFGYFRLDGCSKLVDMDKRVRLVQPNIKQNLKWKLGQKEKNFEKHLNISKSQDHEDVDGFIWSESSIPYPIGFNKDVDRKIRTLVSDGQFLISGGLRVELDRYGGFLGVFNSVYFFNKDRVNHYDKHHLVPFGEYVPLQKYLPFVSKITDGAQGFSRGVGPKTIEFEGLKIPPLICYEVIFPFNVTEDGKRPNLFVNVTNDAWFLTSSGPYQHLNMAKMRAVEYGISLIRAANTGVSAYIDPYGRIIDKIKLNETGFIDIDLKKPIKPTIFSQFKYFVLLYIMLGIAVLLVIFTILKKPKSNERHKKS